MSNAGEVKAAVRTMYGKIAKESTSCCGPNCGCGPEADEGGLTIQMNASYDQFDPAIAEAADLGLGCGTPTAFADLCDGMTVLDLGSGAGIDVFLAAKQIAPSGVAIGLDMTDEMITRAQDNQKKLGITNAEFRKGEIEAMPVDSNSVDRIISNCVLNLVPNKATAFAEMHRVLKVGGKFTVSDIVAVGMIPDETRANMALWAGCIAGAVQKEEYLKLIDNAGFKHVAVVTDRPYVLEQETEFALHSITVTAEK